MFNTVMDVNQELSFHQGILMGNLLDEELKDTEKSRILFIVRLVIVALEGILSQPDFEIY